MGQQKHCFQLLLCRAVAFDPKSEQRQGVPRLLQCCPHSLSLLLRRRPTCHTCGVLIARNLSVTLGAARVLHDVDLSVKSGEILHLTGGNGAGKTTLLRVLCGLTASSGSVEVQGHSPRSVAGRTAFAFVPDEAELYDDLTVAEHAQFASLAYAAPLSDLQEALKAFHMEHRMDQYPAELSRGTRQKVGLALALGLKRPLTVLDEPFGTLDTESRQVLRDGLSSLAAAGRCAVLTTHGGELTQLGRVRQVSVGALQGNGS